MPKLSVSKCIDIFTGNSTSWWITELGVWRIFHRPVSGFIPPAQYHRGNASVVRLLIKLRF